MLLNTEDSTHFINLYIFIYLLFMNYIFIFYLLVCLWCYVRAVFNHLSFILTL
jgi:hypothetical protein